MLIVLFITESEADKVGSQRDTTIKRLILITGGWITPAQVSIHFHCGLRRWSLFLIFKKIKRAKYPEIIRSKLKFSEISCLMTHILSKETLSVTSCQLINTVNWRRSIAVVVLRTRWVPYCLLLQPQSLFFTAQLPSPFHVTQLSPFFIGETAPSPGCLPPPVIFTRLPPHCPLHLKSLLFSIHQGAYPFHSQFKS